jgi:hypothetical protein
VFASSNYWLRTATFSLRTLTLSFTTANSFFFYSNSFIASSLYSTRGLTSLKILLNVIKLQTHEQSIAAAKEIPFMNSSLNLGS